MENEIITRWQSHKHPDNPHYMQVVKYIHIQYPDGRKNLYWHLANCSSNDYHLIPNISLGDAQSMFSDDIISDITEDDFQK